MNQTPESALPLDASTELHACVRQIEGIGELMLMYAASPPGTSDESMEGRHVRAIGELLGEHARAMARYLDVLERTALERSG